VADASRSGASRQKNRGRIPALEWIAAGIGLLLTLGILGAIGWEAVRGDGDRLPAIEVEVGRIVPAAGGYAVEVELRNLSPATAAGVEVEGELTRGDGTTAISTVVVDYVPGRSTRTAGLFFREDPRAHGLKVRALGYSEP
jgi:uncharacterized protein (TIGR02588 family)